MSVLQFGSKKQTDTLTTVLGNQLMSATVGNEADGKASTSFNSLDSKNFICVVNFGILGENLQTWVNSHSE